MPNGPWTAYSGGFQNGMTLAITPKNVVLRDNSLKPLLQCINYVILKIFKIETFWSTLMAKFMLLGVIGMCSINFIQKMIFLGGSCILTDTKFMECTKDRCQHSAITTYLIDSNFKTWQLCSEQRAGSSVLVVSSSSNNLFDN